MPSAPCPSDETLAAYVDGRLSAPETAEVTAHLAACDSCREIVAGSVQLLDELGLSNAEGAHHLGDSRRTTLKFAPWVAAAAALALTVVGIRFAGWGGAPESFPSAEILRDWSGSVDGLRDDWADHGWPTYRGGAPAPTTANDVAFRIGVRLADLEVVARGGGDVGTAVLLLQQALRQSPIGSALAPLYDGIDARDEVRRAELEASVANALASAYLDLGRWSQATRVLALTESPRTGELLDWGIERFSDLELPPVARAALGRVVAAREEPEVVTGLPDLLGDLVTQAGSYSQ